jgi:hypothetical protein
MCLPAGGAPDAMNWSTKVRTSLSFLSNMKSYTSLSNISVKELPILISKFFKDIPL